MSLALIAAAAGPALAIGKDGALPWHFRTDLQHFKDTTLGHPVLMGRKTYASILKTLHKPLPGRQNFVVTRDPTFQDDRVTVVHDLDAELRTTLHNHNQPPLFVIGGGDLYRQTIDVADTVYLTHIDQTVVDADTFFPTLSPETWHKTQERQVTEKGVQLRFCTYVRLHMTVKLDVVFDGTVLSRVGCNKKLVCMTAPHDSITFSVEELKTTEATFQGTLWPEDGWPRQGTWTHPNNIRLVVDDRYLFGYGFAVVEACATSAQQDNVFQAGRVIRSLCNVAPCASWSIFVDRPQQDSNDPFYTGTQIYTESNQVDMVVSGLITQRGGHLAYGWTTRLQHGDAKDHGCFHGSYREVQSTRLYGDVQETLTLVRRDADNKAIRTLSLRFRSDGSVVIRCANGSSVIVSSGEWKHMQRAHLESLQTLLHSCLPQELTRLIHDYGTSFDVCALDRSFAYANQVYSFFRHAASQVS